MWMIEYNMIISRRGAAAAVSDDVVGVAVAFIIIYTYSIHTMYYIRSHNAVISTTSL
jgi:hypothetical protein